MKLEKYIKRAKWNDVKKEFVKWGYDDRYNTRFKHVFYTLKAMPAIPNSRVINVYRTERWAYHSKSRHEEDWQELMITPWAACLGMEVIRGKDGLRPPGVVARCVWSMTYLGWSEKRIAQVINVPL
jgi:hypothetical protein